MDQCRYVVFKFWRFEVLIQDLWGIGMEWYEAEGEEVFDYWIRWTKMIEFVASIRIPKGYFPRATEETYKAAQLHVFASEIAYLCSVYIRTAVGSISGFQRVLISAITKMVPLKPMSIARLELQR